MPNSMRPSENGYKLLRAEEGCILHPYLCKAGKATIGYGCTYYEDGTKVTMQDPSITMERAESLLQILATDIGNKIYDMCDVILTQNQFDALVDFAFNLGISALQGSSLMRKINNGWTPREVADEFERWCYVRDPKTGKKNKDAGVLRRRLTEKALFIY